MPPSLAKCGVDGGGQSWVAMTMAPLARAISISRSIAGVTASPPRTANPPAVARRDDRVTSRDGESTRGVGELVLDVDDDEAGPGPLALHAASLSQPPP